MNEQRREQMSIAMRREWQLDGGGGLRGPPFDG